MRHSRLGIVRIVLSMVAFAVVAVPSIVRADDVLKTLRPEHPRLYLSADGFAALSQRVQKVEPYRSWLALLEREAETMLESEPVKYEQVGPRLLAQSRLALGRIITLAGLYRLDGDQRKADRAIKEMLAAAAFPDWNPKHFLDTAEMTHALAIGYDWLFDELTAADRAIIRTAIVEKGLRPGMKYYKSGKGWPRRVNNWNLVCNGGMTIGALAIADEEPDLAGQIIDLGRKSIVRAMRTFAPDGGWNEGPMYWDYATRYTVPYLAALESALGTDFDFLSAPGFAQTGEFRIHATGPTGLVFNFGDARDTQGLSPQMLWLARKFNRPEFAEFEQKIVGNKPRMQHLLFSRDDKRGPNEVSRKIDRMPTSVWFRGIDVAFLRSDWTPSAVYVGFKAGDNRVSHSHLDLGSFVLDANGVRWAVDLGADDYGLPAYFGRSRWTYFRLRTESHNTLTIDGANQHAAAKTPITAFSDAADRSFAIADLTEAYGDKVERVRRGIALVGRRDVLVQDEISATEDIELTWNMFTPAKIALDGNRAELTHGGKKLFAQILEPADAKFQTAAADAPPPQAQQPDIQALRVEMPLKKGRHRLAVRLSPVSDLDNHPPVSPLDDWSDARESR